MRSTVWAVVLAMAVLWAPVARASTYSQLLHIYQTKGTIPPCSFTSTQLEGVLNSLDTHAPQAFTNAIDAALAERAGGACAPLQKTTALTQLGAPADTGRILGGPVPAPNGARVPAPIVVLAVFAALFLLAGVLGGSARVFGWDPAWAASWRHSWREAEYRAGGGWLALLDRLGRRTPSPPQGPNRSS